MKIPINRKEKIPHKQEEKDPSKIKSKIKLESSNHKKWEFNPRKTYQVGKKKQHTEVGESKSTYGGGGGTKTLQVSSLWIPLLTLGMSKANKA